MKKLIFHFLKIIIPNKIRQRLVHKVEKEKFKIKKNILLCKILRFYEKSNNNSKDVYDIIKFLKKNGLQIFPYNFVYKHLKSDVKVYRDEKENLKFVMHNGRKLFFKRSLSVNAIKSLYRGLLIDQDPNSPHKYLDKNFQVESSDIVVDAGSAEGNFSLEIVEKVKAIYLFENDPEWIEPLQATFAPWKDKVTIIKKKIGNRNSTEEIKLDTFFEEKNFTFVKADIEGSELDLLQGFNQTLSVNIPLKLVICTYHKQNDYENFNNLLKLKGFSTSTTPGFMIFYYDKFIKPPYLRKALIRAVKK